MRINHAWNWISWRTARSKLLVLLSWRHFFYISRLVLMMKWKIKVRSGCLLKHYSCNYLLFMLCHLSGLNFAYRPGRFSAFVFGVSELYWELGISRSTKGLQVSKSVGAYTGKRLHKNGVYMLHISMLPRLQCLSSIRECARILDCAARLVIQRTAYAAIYERVIA